MKHRRDSPNILVFFSDQQRADTCGCYGQGLPVTPHLDVMAADGVRFKWAMSMQPVCGPARSALMTGRYPTATGCFRNNIGLPPDCPTIATQLNAAGYETAYIGKWHLASSRDSGDPQRPDRNLSTAPVPPEARGDFRDYWLAADVLEFTSTSYSGHMFDAEGKPREFPAGQYRADVQTDWVLDYLENRPTEKPFFLVTSYIEPHHQNSSGHYEGPQGSKDQWRDFTPPADLRPGEGNWEAEYPDYLGCCHALDNGLGRVRAKLETLGLADNTVIIYLSDHGSHFCTRNGEYKRSCHDASLHVPLVMSGPGIAAGEVIDRCVSLIDIPPTILALAGADPLPAMHGRNLLPLMNHDVSGLDEVFFQISESEVGRGIRTPTWKYAVTAPGLNGSRIPAADSYQEAYLYHLETDPAELCNRVTDAALVDIRATLAERLKTRMVEVGEAQPIILPASV